MKKSHNISKTECGGFSDFPYFLSTIPSLLFSGNSSEVYIVNYHVGQGCHRDFFINISVKNPDMSTTCHHTIHL